MLRSLNVATPFTAVCESEPFRVAASGFVPSATFTTVEESVVMVLPKVSVRRTVTDASVLPALVVVG